MISVNDYTGEFRRWFTLSFIDIGTFTFKNEYGQYKGSMVSTLRDLLLISLLLPLLIWDYVGTELNVYLFFVVPILFALFIIIHELSHYLVGKLCGIISNYVQVSLWLFTIVYIPGKGRKLGILFRDGSKLFGATGCVSVDGFVAEQTGRVSGTIEERLYRYRDKSIVMVAAGPISNLILSLTFGILVMYSSGILFEIFLTCFILNIYLFLCGLMGDGLMIYKFLTNHPSEYMDIEE